MELEVALSLWPLFTEPLSIVHSMEESPGQVRKSDKVTCLLSVVRSLFI